MKPFFIDSTTTYLLILFHEPDGLAFVLLNNFH